MDHLDQLTTVYSVAFAPDATRLAAGTDRAIQLFDCAAPGRDALTTMPVGGGRSPISCIKWRHDDTNLMAVGSFSGAVALLDARAPPSQGRAQESLVSLATLHDDDGAGPRGITQVAFSPDGWQLYCVSRQRGEIVQWDLRTTRIARRLGPRPSRTCQRIAFDIAFLSSADEGQVEGKGQATLITGDQDGMISFYHLGATASPQNCDADLQVEDSMRRESLPLVRPAFSFRGAPAIVSAAIASPTLPNVFASISGERSFPPIADAPSDDETSSADDSAPIAEGSMIKLWRVAGRRTCR